MLPGSGLKIFADGADLPSIRGLAVNPIIDGYTTNPTLMRKALVQDYKAFALEALKLVGDKPISFEVFADDSPTMERQARLIASWGTNIYVKIPVTNTMGQSMAALIRDLSGSGVQLNITAVFTMRQVQEVTEALHPRVPAIISVFAGRVADAGRDPVLQMRNALVLVREFSHVSLLWASPRQVYDYKLAASIGCDIITMTPDLIQKLALFGKSLDEFSLKTVQMFHRDAIAAGYEI